MILFFPTHIKRVSVSVDETSFDPFGRGGIVFFNREFVVHFTVGTAVHLLKSKSDRAKDSTLRGNSNMLFFFWLFIYGKNFHLAFVICRP